jgi:F0F1-type ATP synthase assembly protein I
MHPEKKALKGQKKEVLFPYTKVNTILFVAGFASLILGYAALAVKPWNSFISLTVAPILLVLGYCVFIPVAILYHKKAEKPQQPTDS